MEEILYDWKKLSLTGDEDVKLSLSRSKNLRRKEYILAAKFLTKRALNVEAIGRTFKPLWRAKKDFKVREVGDHILLFVFELEADAERVLANEPWTFDKHIVLLQRFDGSTPPRHLRFTKLKLWVQIHGLPISLLDPETAMELGESLGQVTSCENPNELVGGDFLRIHVEIDVSKPLCRGRKVALDDSNERWIAFKYEKLPNFCYWCGLISHDGKDCDLWLARKETGHAEPTEYGPWLRAMPFNPGKTAFTVVSGLGDGLGGTSKIPEAATERENRPAETDPARRDSGELNGVDQPQVHVMENSETEAQPSPESQENRSPLNEVITSKSDLFSYHIDPIDFDAQIQEIDVALNSNIGKKKDVDCSLIDSPHVLAKSGGTATSPMTDHSQASQEQTHHVAAIKSLRTWKRVARESTMETEISQGPMNTKRYRDEDLEVLPELPTKKLQVSMEDCQQNKMVEAAQQPRQAQ